MQKSAGKILSGGTTVSGTMILAHLAGIEVFATGGIGGVHVGGESSLDISADLRELGRTPVAVVSSGCKSFLDIPRTLEYLETEGVGVATFADKTEDHAEFPAFWSRKSGVRSPSTIYNTKEAAAIICKLLTFSDTLTLPYLMSCTCPTRLASLPARSISMLQSYLCQSICMRMLTLM